MKYLFLLPSESTKAIVNLGDAGGTRLMISCVLPKRQRKLYGWKPQADVTTVVETDALLLTHIIQRLPNGTYNNEYSFHYVNPKVNDKLELQVVNGPHCAGWICWGNLRPGNLREANAQFWTSGFEGQPKFSKPIAHGWRDYTATYCGNNFISTEERADAVFLTDEQEFLDQTPDEFHLLRNGKPCVVGFVKDTPQGWRLWLENEVNRVAAYLAPEDYVLYQERLMLDQADEDEDEDDDDYYDYEDDEEFEEEE